ncbi:hypothetical protein HYW99_03405 [Candidatus Woesearchaeota archaeon]|nr:hypothetical protein [Candidatus Woesearchaeota archaeon]
MEIKINTKEDSHEDIRRVIKMLQNLIGDFQEMTNVPESMQPTTNAFTNIFGDTTPQATSTQGTPQESSESTEDLFAELFSEEELKKMDTATVKDEDEGIEVKTRGEKYNIELY